MVNRTTATIVKTLTGSTLPDATVEVFIGVANRLVTDKLAAKGLLDTQLADIEAFLSAHFLVPRDRSTELTEQEVNDTRAVYGGKYGMNLDHTSWGQQAKILDTSGTLMRLDKAKATFRVFGPEPPEDPTADEV